MADDVLICISITSLHKSCSSAATSSSTQNTTCCSLQSLLRTLRTVNKLRGHEAKPTMTYRFVCTARHQSAEIYTLVTVYFISLVESISLVLLCQFHRQTGASIEFQQTKMHFDNWVHSLLIKSKTHRVFDKTPSLGIKVGR